jgi:hypothetical protein
LERGLAAHTYCEKGVSPSMVNIVEFILRAVLSIRLRCTLAHALAAHAAPSAVLE